MRYSHSLLSLRDKATSDSTSTVGLDVKKLEVCLKYKFGNFFMKITTVVFVLTIAMVSHLAFADEINSEHKVLGSGNGRYAFGQISNARADQFMIDTQTARVWEIVWDSKTNRPFLRMVLYQLFDGEMKPYPEDSPGMKE